MADRQTYRQKVRERKERGGRHIYGEGKRAHEMMNVSKDVQVKRSSCFMSLTV